MALVMAPLSARAADLVVWWDKGYYAEEDGAVREIIAAFEHDTGKQVEFVVYPQAELPGKIEASLEVGQPPDFAFGFWLNSYAPQWAFDDRLVDLSDAIGHLSDLFDPDVLSAAKWLNSNSRQRALYGLPMGRATTHIHVWKSLLERAGFTLADIPKDWDAFWAFWCDEVQPAIRRVTGRKDIWGVGLAMSGEPSDTQYQFFPFLVAYNADYVTRDGRLVIDDPEIRRKLVQALERYTAIWRKGCTPPESLDWNLKGNNDAFLAQTVVMTINETLSIPNALKRDWREDYYKNTATLEWPLGPDGQAFPIGGDLYFAEVFKKGGHIATAKDFVRFLVAGGWLAQYLDFSAERMLPPMPKLLDAPF
jgi:multiple sugar transport system substrate-binding protein